MGELINFRLREDGDRTPARGCAAKILFFTGVRYQREEPHDSKPAPIPTGSELRRGGGKVGSGRRRPKG